MLKIILIAIFIITSGAVIARPVRRYLRRKKKLRAVALSFAVISGTLVAIELVGLTEALVVWVQRRFEPSQDEVVRAAIQSCNTEVKVKCLQNGAAFGASAVVTRLRSCKNADIVRSDELALQWKDIWTTNVYSYAPGGGGSGGGLDDDVLRVGGWGDWYFSLIQFNLPPLQRRPQFAAIVLYSKEYEGASVPVALDRIIHRWDFPKGGTLWWRDRPGHRAMTTDPLPAPRREQWYIIELTGLVHEWLDRKSENYGIQIRPTHDFGNFVFFVSSDAADKSKIPHLIFCP